jgi:hypothetical protein
MMINIKLVVLHPHRVVEVELGVGKLYPQRGVALILSSSSSRNRSNV